MPTARTTPPPPPPRIIAAQVHAYSAALIGALALPTPAAATPPAAAPAYPGEHWETRAPAEVGMVWTSGEANPTNTAMGLLVSAVAQAGEDGRPVGAGDDGGKAEKESPGAAHPAASPAAVRAHRYAQWAPIELRFEGRELRARGEPNPFAVAFDVIFEHPGGRRYVVPGFYDGDGRGGPDGKVWKVRFSTDETGRWTYRTRCADPALGGRRGSFEVGPPPGDAEGFWKWGRLESVGAPENGIRYLKFRHGPYWMKAGCDDPENFLGRYRHFDTPAERVAAVDYLASKGVNSLYLMTHNIGGDDKDVWPWLGERAPEAKRHGTAGNVRFDTAKLARWRELFLHMQTRGVVPYLVLEDDSAWKGYDHDRYYREVIARFGDLPAVVFNIGEEHNENYRLADALALAGRFRRLDPYRHPLGIHNVNRPDDAYIGAPQIDFTAIQTGSPGRRPGLEFALAHNGLATGWIERCIRGGHRVLMVNFDEGRPKHDRRAWWSAYLGGGVWEAHVLPPYDRPHRAWEKVWTELGGARAFMESLPFWEMEPHNGLVVAGRAFCLARPGVAYALYLPVGGEVAVDLRPGVTYAAAWWDPAQGRDGRFGESRHLAGGTTKFTAPGAGDWALRVLAVKEN